MPGQSGACVVRHGDGTATKSYLEDVDDARRSRLVGQGVWLAQHSCPALPRVFDVSRRGYVMEELTELPMNVLDWNAVRLELVRILEEHVWSRACDTDAEWSNFVSYLGNLGRTWAPDVEPVLVGMAHDLLGPEFHLISQCLAHGDPTASNVMLRTTGGLVLVDPDPTTYMPSSREVDLGKMLMSAWGYETLRFGWGRCWDEFDVDDATWYLGCVHVLRAIPYLPAHLRGAFHELLVAKLHIRY